MRIRSGARSATPPDPHASRRVFSLDPALSCAANKSESGAFRTCAVRMRTNAYALAHASGVWASAPRVYERRVASAPRACAQREHERTYARSTRSRIKIRHPAALILPHRISLHRYSLRNHVIALYSDETHVIRALEYPNPSFRVRDLSPSRQLCRIKKRRPGETTG